MLLKTKKIKRARIFLALFSTAIITSHADTRANEKIIAGIAACVTGASARSFSKKIVKPLAVEKITPFLLDMFKSADEKPTAPAFILNECAKPGKTTTLFCGPHDPHCLYNNRPQAPEDASVKQADKSSNATKFENFAKSLMRIVIGATGEAGVRSVAEVFLRNAYLVVGVDAINNPGAAFLTRAFGLGQIMAGVAIDLDTDMPTIIPIRSTESVIIGLLFGMIGGQLIIQGTQDVIESILMRRILIGSAIPVLEQTGNTLDLNPVAINCGANMAVIIVDIVPQIIALISAYRAMALRERGAA